VRRPAASRRPHADHADDWLITYADTITLLLCLFAVLLSTALNRNLEHKPVVATVTAPPPPPSPAMPLQPPDILEGNLPMHGTAHASEPSADAEEVLAAPPPRPAPQRPRPQPAPIASTAPIASAELRNRLQSQGTPIVEQAGVEPAGERVHTIQISSNAFFAPGSATLSDSGKTVLAEVAARLKSPSYDGYQITVEGHTDDEPVHGGNFPSNWELSTARAAAVVRCFIDSGIPAFRLRAAGYADTFPTVPNRDASGRPLRDNQARNRRVVIRLDRLE
jgi:chemotaxis protein MotB